MVFLTFDVKYALVTSAIGDPVFLLLFKRPFILQDGIVLGRVFNGAEADRAAKSFLKFYNTAVTFGYKISDGRFVHPKYGALSLSSGLSQSFTDSEGLSQESSSFIAWTKSNTLLLVEE